VVPRPVEEVFDEVDERRLGPLHVLEHEHDGIALRHAFEEQPGCREQVLTLGGRALLQPEQLREARFDPAAFVRVVDMFLEGGAELRGRVLLRLALRDARAASEHLGERPVGHALAVRERPSAVPVRGGGESVEVT
jgi:hypothetical protein